jgi:hypothetical protein
MAYRDELIAAYDAAKKLCNPNEICVEIKQLCTMGDCPLIQNLANQQEENL